jgi:glucuronoarabinoxylan endo-1,4-beta-xylanase
MTKCYVLIIALFLATQVTAQVSFTITPAIQHQEMVGFGAALTWYCDRITSSPQKNAITQLLFNDLGTDIIRLKNWYYPQGYPAVKSTTTMEVSWFKQHFTATNQLFTLAKTINPNIEVLLSSWGPPSALKSNDSLNGGTLKKNGGGQYMYPEFGQYWVDVLDNITFSPDYISIQNEPGFVTTGWETCKFHPTDTGTYPGYDLALDEIYNQIKLRSYVPKMLAPEIESISNSTSNSTINNFRKYSTLIKDRPYLYGYAYHLYNFYNKPNKLDTSLLKIIKNEFNNHPNFMTEFSSNNFNWLQTADAIHETVTHANASAYIYWEMMWDENSTSALVRVNGSGNYTINDQYYAIKHFAKYIDKGYKRIDVIGSDSLIKTSAFINPAADQITAIVVNNDVTSKNISLNLGGVNSVQNTAYRSTNGNYFQNIGAADLGSSIAIPAQSITTFVIDICSAPCITNINTQNTNNSAEVFCYPNPFNDNFTIVNNSESFVKIDIIDVLGQKVANYNLAKGAHDISLELSKGIYFVKIEEDKVIKIIKQ